MLRRNSFSRSIARSCSIPATSGAAGKVTSRAIVGTWESRKHAHRFLKGPAVLGNYGSPKQDAMLPFYAVTELMQKLAGANRYPLRFAPGQLPPVHAFWSLT